MASPAAPFGVSRAVQSRSLQRTQALLLCAELAERHDTGIHTHLLETRKQAELAQTRYRTTMVRHLEELGVLSDRWSCAHSIWLTG